MNSEIMRRDMKEAMDSGERALSSLRNAQATGDCLICLVEDCFLP